MSSFASDLKAHFEDVAQKIPLRLVNVVGIYEASGSNPSSSFLLRPTAIREEHDAGNSHTYLPATNPDPSTPSRTQENTVGKSAGGVRAIRDIVAALRPNVRRASQRTWA